MFSKLYNTLQYFTKVATNLVFGYNLALKLKSSPAQEIAKKTQNL